MSDLNVATTAEIVAADLGLPFTIVPWTPPLVGTSRPSVGLRRALALLDEQGGGLLVAHVVRDALGHRPTRREARDALVATLHDTPVAEVRALACTDGVAVIAHIAPPPAPWVPAELEPVEGAAGSDLRASAASAVEALVRRRDLAGVDDDLALHDRLLVAAGALAVVEGELVPTVAGLVAFGRAPWEHLGGLRAEVVDDRRELAVVGDGPTLPQRVVRALRVPEPNAELVRALVERGLIERAWSAHPDDEPIVVRQNGQEIEVRWPGAGGEDMPNRALRRLLRAAGGLGRLAEDLVRIADRVTALGGEWFGEDVEDGDTVVRVALPEVDMTEPVEVEAPRQRVTVRKEEPDRDLVARPVVVAAPVVAGPVAPPVPRATATIARPVTAPAKGPPTTVPLPAVAAAAHVAASDRDAAVLALVDAQGHVTTRDVIERLGWTRSTARDVLARMVAAGRLASLAASTRSPFQAYARPSPQAR